MCDAARKIDVQPPRHAPRHSREDDLVELLALEGLFDGVHRVVTGRHGRIRLAPCRLVDEWRCEGEDVLGLGVLLQTLVLGDLSGLGGFGINRLAAPLTGR